jgi:ribosome-binding factor A
MVTVSAVEVARDLSHAKVYITLLGGSEHATEALGILHKAAGFLRHLLAQRVTMRTTPELHFVYDASVERGMRLTELIDEAVAADRRRDEE